MGFLRKSKSKTGRASEEEVTTASVPDTKSPRKSGLFGIKKKSARNLSQSGQETTTSSRLIFQTKFVTVDGKDIDDHNTTVDSTESIVLTPLEAQRELQLDNPTQSQSKQEQQRGEKYLKEVFLVHSETEGTELFLPGSTDVNEIDTICEEKDGLDSGGELRPPSKITINEKREEDDKQVEETARNTASSSTDHNELKDISMLDLDDDDDITANKPPFDTFSASQTTNSRSHPLALAAGAFVQAVTCTAQDVQNCASLTGNLRGIALPATACQPIINQQAAAARGAAGHRNPQPEIDYYNDQFATKFLNGMLNVGFTLVHHDAVDGEEDWIGRTVNLNFKPGVCTTCKIVGPAIQWTTLLGGKVKDVERHSIGLFDIDAVAVSNVQNELDPVSSQQYEEELDCFFSITSNDGDVHMFEALNADECHRIVAGIKNLVFRLSAQVIAGDFKAVGDFFDNSQEPPETYLRRNEAMLRISHAFLDDML